MLVTTQLTASIDFHSRKVNGYQHSSKYLPLCSNKGKKLIPVWNDLRVIKLLQNYYFWVCYPFKKCKYVLWSNNKIKYFYLIHNYLFCLDLCLDLCVALFNKPSGVKLMSILTAGGCCWKQNVIVFQSTRWRVHCVVSVNAEPP